MSAAETNLRKLDVEQAQVLLICIRAFKTSPAAAIPVEMGEMPLRIRRVKNVLAYWVNLKGHNKSHPTEGVVQECWSITKPDVLVSV